MRPPHDERYKKRGLHQGFIETMKTTQRAFIQG